MKTTVVLQAFAGLALVITAYAGFAQTPRFPEKPVRITVGYSPGGLPDTVARVLAQKLTERWGQTVFVENRPAPSAQAALDVFQVAQDQLEVLQ